MSSATSMSGGHGDVDVAVVGAGAAGLYAALCAANEGATVALLSAMPLAQTASYWAQGGLAAVLATDDSFKLHLSDTERAGRGAVRDSAAEVLVSEAPERVRDLERLGFHFDADRHGRLALGLEGGHSVRRIVHAGGSATGRRLLRELSALVVGHPRVRVIEGARVSQLLCAGGRCTGVVCQASEDPDDRHTLRRIVTARATVLSTGGAAALWARTTNPPGSIGQGLLLARAAGATLADLEFVQFHPTAVIGVEGREGFLITEAIRGEGATLLDGDGQRFVDELAPRDEVSRAIQSRLHESGASSVSLDMRAIDPALFPNVVGALREAGLDPTCELVPVAPAAHYTIGGIVTDLHARSAVPGLYAVGETACTGLHGANRLASNSLSECFVFGRRAALAALDEPALDDAVAEVSRTAIDTGPSTPEVGASVDWRLERSSNDQQDIRLALWRHAGIERSADGLSELLDSPHPLARLIARSALMRKESRGTHTRSDYLQCDTRLDGKHVVVQSSGELELDWQNWR
ncbi:MAG TPA: FAD-dependent oxidoreductase [Solirubrobacteraceae bacterium]|jgi:L-aspartate oxidase|nr:FAD-dependent oxidoreductase [Solirubrobacteraceae bacterium]